MVLTSKNNRALQSVRRAASSGRPTEDGLVVVEGPHLVTELLRSSWSVKQIYATARARQVHSGILEQGEAPLTEVSEPAFEAIATTVHTQGLVALAQPRAWSWRDLFSETALVVVFDGIQDPGNAGTILRSAEAFGASGVVLLKGSVQVSNGKLLRAAAGSIFRIPYLESVTAMQFLREAEAGGLTSIALTSHASTTLDQLDLTCRCVLIVGSEGAGVSPELLADTRHASIPTMAVESLNAGVACSLALYEAARQRRRG